MTENKDGKNSVGNISPRHAASIEVSTVVSDMDLFPKFGASSRGRPSEDQISEVDPRLQFQREVLVSKSVPLCLELKMRSEKIIGSPTADFTGEKSSDNGDFKFCELEVKFGEKLSNWPSEDSESLDQGSDHSELMIKEHYNSAHEIEMEALSVESNVLDLDGEIKGRKSSSNKDSKFEICASDSVSNSESLKATSKDFDPNPAATDQNFDPMVSKDAHTQELSEIQEERETLNSRIMNESISGNYKQVREFYEDGSSYIGTKLNDKKHGQGALTLANGSKYDGDWKDDLMCGLGKLYYDSGKLAYKGGFFMNKVDGYGCMYNGQNMLKNSGTLLYSILSSDGFTKNGFVKPTEQTSGMIFDSKIN
jgi:antitoxin component YwqK of YwqJK toxin-antitoxin module